MPKNSFPAPENKPTYYPDAYADYQPSLRERAVNFADDAAFGALTGALIGSVVGFGAEYALNPNVRTLVNENFFESGTGAPFDYDNLRDSQLGSNDESHAFDGLVYGAYEPADANSLPIGVESGTAFTIPDDIVFDVITQPGK